jgi:pilus assembly protein CpaE
MDIIKIIIASNDPEYRQELVDSLVAEEDFLIIGEAVNGANAVKKAEHLFPDIIIMDDSLPIMEGIAATEKITLTHPNIGVIIIGTKTDEGNVKSAMLAGARDYLYKEDIQAGEIAMTIRRIFLSERTRMASMAAIQPSDRQQKYKPPQVVTIFGAKGGSGKTTVSVNLAVKIANDTKKKVVLVDLDLQFGDVASYLNVQPRRTIAEFVQERNQWDVQLMNSYLITHNSGVRILAAPLRPEDAELVTPDQVEKIITLLRKSFDYIIIDSPPYITDSLLTALDMSNQIILIMTLDLPSVKNLKLSLNLLDGLHHSGKTKLVINRGSSHFGITAKDVEKTVDFLAAEEIPSDGRVVVDAVNKGMPFVLSHPDVPASKSVERLAQMIINDYGYQNDLRTEKDHKAKTKPIMKRLFG